MTPHHRISSTLLETRRSINLNLGPHKFKHNTKLQKKHIKPHLLVNCTCYLHATNGRPLRLQTDFHSAKQKADDALSTELGENPRWPSRVLEAGVPFTDDWPSKQMPPPTGYSSWEQWRKSQSEGGTVGHKLNDKEFDAEISRAFD